MTIEELLAKGADIGKFVFDFLQKTYSKTRLAFFAQPEVRAKLKFVSVIDGRTSKICKACNGIVMYADDPRWNGFTPPMHTHCRSQIMPTEDDVTMVLPIVTPQKGYGESK